jgi:plastocyanin domain-containing protein
MTIRKSTLNNLFSITALIVGLGIVFLVMSNQGSVQEAAASTTFDANGQQIIALTAKAGYSPRSITAQAGVENILRIKTANTFDCSSALRIPTLNITKLLPSNGTTDITIAAQTPGTVIKGTCSMGMYSFQITFI